MMTKSTAIYRPSTFTGQSMATVQRWVSRDFWGTKPYSHTQAALSIATVVSAPIGFKHTSSLILEYTGSLFNWLGSWCPPIGFSTTGSWLNTLSTTYPNKPSPLISVLPSGIFTLAKTLLWPGNWCLPEASLYGVASWMASPAITLAKPVIDWAPNYARYVLTTNLPLTIISWLLVNSLPEKQRGYVNLAAGVGMMILPAWLAPTILVATAGYAFSCQMGKNPKELLLPISDGIAKGITYIPGIDPNKKQIASLGFSAMAHNYLAPRKQVGTPTTAAAQPALFAIDLEQGNGSNSVDSHEADKVRQAILKNRQRLQLLLTDSPAAPLMQMRTTKSQQELASLDLGAATTVGLYTAEAPMPGATQFTSLVGNQAAISDTAIWVATSTIKNTEEKQLANMVSLIEATMIFCAKQDSDGDAHIETLLHKRQKDEKSPGMRFCCSDLETCQAIYTLVKSNYSAAHADLIVFYKDTAAHQAWDEEALKKIKLSPTGNSLARKALSATRQEADHIKTHYASAPLPTKHTPTGMLWQYGKRAVNHLRGHGNYCVTSSTTMRRAP